MNSPSADHDALFEIAAAQEGFFTTEQAREAGFSHQLIRKHVQSGRFQPVMRTIYRLKYFPFAEREELIVAWLWSRRLGVFSHQTALYLHDLSDAFPARYSMIVPKALLGTRRRAPDNIILRSGRVSPEDRTWYGSVLVTRARRTISDCIEARVDRLLIDQALEEASGRGLITPGETDVLRARLEASWSGL